MNKLSPRKCARVDLIFLFFIFCKKDNYAVQLCQKAGHMTAGDVHFCLFAPRNERFKQIDIKT